MKNLIFPLFIAMLIAISLSGCGSMMKALVGYHNVNSVDLAKQCMVDSALATIELGKGHASKVNQAQNVLLEALYLRELNREEEAKALYPKIRKLVRGIKTDKQVDRELTKAQKDLGKMRKKEGFSPDCE